MSIENREPFMVSMPLAKFTEMIDAAREGRDIPLEEPMTDETKSKMFSVALTPTMYRKMARAADKEGLTARQWLRATVARALGMPIGRK